MDLLDQVVWAWRDELPFSVAGHVFALDDGEPAAVVRFDGFMFRNRDSPAGFQLKARSEHLAVLERRGVRIQHIRKESF